jgi:hypothetical protein
VSDQYPRGKIHPSDQGAFAMVIAIKDGTLIIEFPHPTKWIGLGPIDVQRLIALLQGRLAEMKGAAS